MKTTETNNSQLTKDELRVKVLTFRPRLPRGYVAKVVELLPHLDTAAGGKKIENVAKGITADAEITDALEMIVLNSATVNTTPAA